jgi:hypothetical protein
MSHCIIAALVAVTVAAVWLAIPKCDDREFRGGGMVH